MHKSFICNILEYNEFWEKINQDSQLRPQLNVELWPLEEKEIAPHSIEVLIECGAMAFGGKRN